VPSLSVELRPAAVCHTPARGTKAEEALMANRSTAPGSQDLARLRHRLDGQVLLPYEPGYHQARQVWNAIVDRRPAVIARCASPADVAAAVGFARAHDLEVGVRCGGHSVLGISVPQGGLMVDLTPLRTVRVDPDRRRAWVAGGALLGDLDRAAQEAITHGLACPYDDFTTCPKGASIVAARLAGQPLEEAHPH
jgi:FAD/FMN-containing dehydrogenase